jgi:hypothetical protein
MTCAAIAIRRWQLAYGRPPKQLEQLVPAFLERLPVDYMNGQPLRYRLTPPNDWLLYSVGPDGVDNQGQAGDQSSFNEDWEGPDWVWPRPLEN